MITVQNLRAFSAEMQNRISGINLNHVVIDDTQLALFLKGMKPDENQILLSIIPEYPLQGDQDKLKWNNQLMFMILEKTNDRRTNHEAFLDIMESTQVSALEFVEILLTEKSGDNGNFCGIANELIESSIRVYPIWNKAECHGWAVDIDLLSNP